MPSESTVFIIIVGVVIAATLYLRARAENAGVVQVSAAEGLALVKSGAAFIDVRTPEEFANGHARGVKLIPLADLSGSLGKIPKNKAVVFICASGNRSRQAARLLTRSGYEKVVSVRGGMHAWDKAGLPRQR